MTTRTPSNTLFQCELMRAEQLRFHTTGRRFEPCTARQEHREQRCSFTFLLFICLSGWFAFKNVVQDDSEHG
jgi:hypothetical protein